MVSAFCVDIKFDVELKDSDQNLVSTIDNKRDYVVPGNVMVSYLVSCMNYCFPISQNSAFFK